MSLRLVSVLFFAYFQGATVVIFREDDGKIVRSIHQTRDRSVLELGNFHLWENQTPVQDHLPVQDRTPPKCFSVFITNLAKTDNTPAMCHVLNIATLDQLEPNGLFLDSANFVTKTTRIQSEMPHFKSVDEAAIFMNSHLENTNTVGSWKSASHKLKNVYSKIIRAHQSDVSNRDQMVQERKSQFWIPEHTRFAESFSQFLEMKHQQQAEILKETFVQLLASYQRRETSAANNNASISSASSKQDSTQRQPRKDAQQSSKRIQNKPKRKRSANSESQSKSESPSK